MGSAGSDDLSTLSVGVTSFYHSIVIGKETAHCMYREESLFLVKICWPLEDLLYQ